LFHSIPQSLLLFTQYSYAISVNDARGLPLALLVSLLFVSRC
jgi:hypothetical protein